MSNTYGISITCIPNDRLNADKYEERFFECMSEDELQRIQKENDKNTLKTYLFNTLNMMDSTLSTIATKATPSYVRIIFTIKDGIKGSALNISNKELSATETIVLGGITIVIGIATIYFKLGLIAGIIISYITTWFLTEVYLFLRDKSRELWQNFKKTSNQAMQSIMSFIETDTRTLQERKEEITEKVANKILNSTHQSKMAQKEYEECIAYLCEHCCKDKISDTSFLSPNNTFSFEESLFPNAINSYRKGTIHFSIQALDEYTRIPIKNAKLQLQNINVGQESITDTKGLASFSIKESEYLKPFRAKLISEHYEQCPILDRSIIPNAIRRREKPLELRFLGNRDNLNERRLNYV